MTLNDIEWQWALRHTTCISCHECVQQEGNDRLTVARWLWNLLVERTRPAASATIQSHKLDLPHRLSKVCLIWRLDSQYKSSSLITALNEMLRMQKLYLFILFFTFPQPSLAPLFLPVLLLKKDCAIGFKEFFLHCGWHSWAGGARACWQDTAVSQVGMHHISTCKMLWQENQNLSECSAYLNIPHSPYYPSFFFFSILVSPAIVSVRHPFWLSLMLDFLFGFASYNCLLLWLRYSLCRQFRLSKFVKDITNKFHFGVLLCQRLQTHPGSDSQSGRIRTWLRGQLSIYVVNMKWVTCSVKAQFRKQPHIGLWCFAWISRYRR